MTYKEIFFKAVDLLHLNCFEVEKYEPISEIQCEHLKGIFANSILIWLKTGEKIIFIDTDK